MSWRWLLAFAAQVWSLPGLLWINPKISLRRWYFSSLSGGAEDAAALPGHSGEGEGVLEKLRVLGTTMFANASLYEGDPVLTEELLLYYFHWGLTLVRGGLKAHVVQALAKEMQRVDLSQSVKRQGGALSHLDSDGLFDFLIYSKLGKMVGQIFATEGTETAHLEPVVHLRRSDYMPDQRVGFTWHRDRPDCNRDAPSNYTAQNAVRVAIVMEQAHQTRIIKQPSYASSLPRADRARFWRGELHFPFEDFPLRREHGAADWLLDFESPVAGLPGLRDEEDVARMGHLKPGDVMLWSACSIHSSPPENVRSLITATFFHSAMRTNVYTGRQRTDCDTHLALGQPTGADPKCYPVVYPRPPAAGTKFAFRQWWVDRLV